MKKILFVLIVAVISHGCASYPKNFTYKYQKENTGLEQLIDIDGYYVSQLGCDSTFFSMFMFYPDGLFLIATISEVTPELIDCFENDSHSKICKYPLWGIYRLEGNLIKTQVIRPEGSGCVIFRDYRILEDKSLVNISDYVEPQHTNLAYMANYPSFLNNECEKKILFYPLKKKTCTVHPVPCTQNHNFSPIT